MTMLELAERLGHAGFGWLVEECRRPGAAGRPIDDPLVQDRLAALETEVTELRSLCSDLVERHETGGVGPADASIVKLYYSELLKRMTDFDGGIGGLPDHMRQPKPTPRGVRAEERRVGKKWVRKGRTRCSPY